MNMNDRVRVKLTPYGQNCLRLNHSKDTKFRANLGLPTLPFTLPVTDDEGYSSWTLWELMSAFGPYIGPGLPVPFEDNLVLVCET